MPTLHNKSRSGRSPGMILAGAAAILFFSTLVIAGAASAGTSPLTWAKTGLAQEDAACMTSEPVSKAFAVTVCLSPGGESAVTGSVPVSAAVEVTGTSPGVRLVEFFLDDENLLTDFEAPYTFELPTDYFVDGTYRLSADAIMRDGFVTDHAAVMLTFSNGTTAPPANTRTFTPTSGRPPGPGESFVVAAVGDGASGETAAAQVTDLIASWNPNLFLYLGDVYENGTYTEFVNWYGDETRLFGRFRAITNPTVGNHEYYSPGKADSYHFYWDNVPDYYSFDAAGWHFISINSTGAFRQTGPGTPQHDWLLAELEGGAANCTVAFMQDPAFSLGPHGDIDRTKAIWAALAQNDVEVVLAGNDHNYQRWYALDASGGLDPNGMTLFVLGTGGHSIRGFTRTDTRVAKGYDSQTEPSAFGALYLRLNPRGLEYRFINIAGEVLDFGVISCDSAVSDTTPPQPPSGLVSEITPGGHVLLTWEEASDETGVAGYTVFRDGEALVTLNGPLSNYTDSSTQVNTAYTYSLKAFDTAYNQSAASDPVTATTLSAATVTLNPAADAFVDMSAPDENYGRRPRLRTDTTPVVQSYLRFDVPRLAGAVVSATLRVYANSTSGAGLDVYEVEQNDWGEMDISFNSAPPIGRLIGSSAPFESDMWVTVDVTALVTAEGPVSLALLSTSNTNTAFSSRDGDHPPELIIELGAPASSP